MHLCSSMIRYLEMEKNKQCVLFKLACDSTHVTPLIVQAVFYSGWSVIPPGNQSHIQVVWQWFIWLIQVSTFGTWFHSGSSVPLEAAPDTCACISPFFSPLSPTQGFSLLKVASPCHYCLFWASVKLDCNRCCVNKVELNWIDLFWAEPSWSCLRVLTLTHKWTDETDKQ